MVYASVIARRAIDNVSFQAPRALDLRPPLVSQPNIVIAAGMDLYLAVQTLDEAHLLHERLGQAIAAWQEWEAGPRPPPRSDEGD